MHTVSVHDALKVAGSLFGGSIGNESGRFTVCDMPARPRATQPEPPPLTTLTARSTTYSSVPMETCTHTFYFRTFGRRQLPRNETFIAVGTRHFRVNPMVSAEIDDDAGSVDLAPKEGVRIQPRLE